MLRKYLTLCFTSAKRPLVIPSTSRPPFPSPWMMPDRSSPSRVRFAASRPGLLRVDPRGDRCSQGERGGRRGAAGGQIAHDKDIIIHIKRGLRAKPRNATVTGFEVVPGGGDDHVDLARPR